MTIIKDGNIDGTKRSFREIELTSGTSINEISIDGTLAGDSDDAIPTEKAVKTYVDTQHGAEDDIFYETGQTVSTDYTVAATRNAMSAGPITIDTGVTVTIATGGTWTIV